MSEVLDAATTRRIQQFHRLLISYNDFKHAGQVASYILDNSLHEESANTSRVLLEATNCAMIVSYCRPFSGNDRRRNGSLPDLPGRFLRLLNASERELHSVVMADRNLVLAHSSAIGWALEPVILDLPGQQVLAPWACDTRAPLNRESTEELLGMSSKLMEAVFAQRMEWESELKQYFRHISAADLGVETNSLGPKE